jgi:MHS family proline/betaine transporter-like MFS transporter
MTIQSRVFLGGGLTSFLAQVPIDATGRPAVPGLMIAVVALAVLPVLVRLQETAPRARRRRPVTVDRAR